MKPHIFLLTTFLFLNLAVSQETRKEEKDSFEGFQQEKMFNSTLGIDFYTSEQILSNVIDAKEYILGPGDILFVTIGGMIQESFPIEVLPEGTVIVPEIGVFKLSNKVLFEFKKELNEKLKNQFKDAEISIFLVKLRKFRVYVTGNVKTPGTYFVQQIDRLNDVLSMAGGLTEWADQTKINVKNNDIITSINLDSFLQTGEMANNPLLKQGDNINVPAIDLQNDVVQVVGDISKVGYYPITKNELLLDFLKRTGRLSQKNNLNEIEFVRDKKSQKLNLLNLSENIVLKNKDKIRIKRQIAEVYISGEVNRVGSMPFHPNYTAWDYIALAGLKETSVDVDNVKVIRFETGEVIEGKYTIVYNGDIVRIERKFREDLKDYISVLTPIISLGLSAYAIITR